MDSNWLYLRAKDSKKAVCIWNKSDVFDPCKSLVVNCRIDMGYAGYAKKTKCSKTINMNNWIQVF